MQHCPIEIWEKISRIACADGYTGCSLSLVSKYIHDASRSSRYRCISLVGRRQMSGFARLLETSPAARRIERLFISDHRTDRESYMVWEAAGPPAQVRTLEVSVSQNTDYEPRAESKQGRGWNPFVRRQPPPVLPPPPKPLPVIPHHRDRGLELVRGNERRANDVYDLVLRILRAASPYLRSLTLCLISNMPFTLVPVRLPALAELTCFRDSWRIRGERDDPPPVRTLRRLTVILAYTMPAWSVAEVAPALTHLRLFGLHPGSYMPPKVREFLGLGHLGSAAPPRVPASTKRIVVRVPFDVRDSNIGGLNPFVGSVVDGYQELVKTDPHRIAIVYAKPKKDQHLTPVAVARQMWLDGNMGYDLFEVR